MTTITASKQQSLKQHKVLLKILTDIKYAQTAQLVIAVQSVSEATELHFQHKTLVAYMHVNFTKYTK